MRRVLNSQLPHESEIYLLFGIFFDDGGICWFDVNEIEANTNKPEERLAKTQINRTRTPLSCWPAIKAEKDVHPK